MSLRSRRCRVSAGRFRWCCSSPRSSTGSIAPESRSLSGCGVAGVSVYFAAHAADLTATVVLLSVCVFFQNAYQTAEFALVQRVLPPGRIGAGTGLYNGIAIIAGGAGGTKLLGKVVEATGDYDSGLMIVVAAGIANAVVLAVLARRIRY